MTHSWTARCASTLLVLQLASACDSKPPAPPPADTDTTAPSTRASPAGGAYTAGVTVSLLCDDGAGSGCAATHYTTDGSEPSRTSPTFQDALPVSANTTLKFFSVDKRGNAESVKSQVYTFPSTGGDTQPPTVSASPPGGTYDGARTVTLTCDDAGGSGCAALHYTLDGATPTTGSPRYTGPLSLSANTTLRFFAMDAAGNLASVHTERYVIDLLAPTTTARPAGGTYNSRQDVTLSCDDGVGTGCAATHYTLNGATPTPLSPRYTEGTVLPISANTTLKFLSVDAAGHTEPVQTQTYVIDTTPPTTTASPGAGTYGGTRNVTLSCADEAGSGCKVTYYTTNGTAPGPGSPQYEAGKPLPITANTVVRFLSVDHAGNTESVQVLEYKIDVLPPVTTASPAGGAYNAARDVTLACTDATSTCEATYYTLDGTTPDTHSTRYEDTPLRIATSATLKFFSVDAVGNVEPVRTETYVFPDIAAVRAAEVGPIELPIERVLVTYVKPKTDTDPAGFFLQSRKNGPALFVAVDPATLSPSPLPGDRVSLVATTKDMVAGQTRVTSLQSDSFVVHGRGESLAPLLSDASAADLVARLEDYESEYLTVSGTLSSPFGTSGVGHMQASLSTVGNPHTPGTFTDLKLRMPTPLLTALRDRYDLKQGCSITTTGPLWRYFATAQPSAWEEKDLQVLSCPAPRLLSVVPTSSTSVSVRFDRRIRPESVLASGGQFTLDNGLVAMSATVVDGEVRLTTSSQVVGRTYSLTVAGTVQDVMGTGVDATTRSKSFFGFEKLALLRINEVAPNLVSSNATSARDSDLVELYVMESGSTANMTVTTDNFLVATLPRVQVTTGDIIVVHLSPDAVGNRDAPASETLGKSEYPAASYPSNYDTAWDFHGVPNGFISYRNAVLRVKDPAGQTQDAVAFAQPSSTPPAGFPALLQALQAEGLWEPPDCGGAPCTYDSRPTTAIEVSASWWGLPFSTNDRSHTVYRFNPVYTRSKDDWTTGTSSLGRHNW